MNFIKKILIPYCFVTILGVLLHFTYAWSGRNAFVGIFSAVNESIWEHLKLIYFPMLLLTVIQFSYAKSNRKKRLPARLCGILYAMGFTIVSYYTYTGILGTNIDTVNILIFFLSIAVAFYVEAKTDGHTKLSTQSAVIIMMLLFFLFLQFTYMPPKLAIFQPPTGSTKANPSGPCSGKFTYSKHPEPVGQVEKGHSKERRNPGQYRNLIRSHNHQTRIIGDKCYWNNKCKYKPESLRKNSYGILCIVPEFIHGSN